jgi:hypothetical protein
MFFQDLVEAPACLPVDGFSSMNILIFDEIKKGDCFLSPRGGTDMALKFEWETDFQKALSRGKAEKKNVILDFFNPG